MSSNKIVRSVCLFEKAPNKELINKVRQIASKLRNSDFVVQTRRICSPLCIRELTENFSGDEQLLLSAGSLSTEDAIKQLQDFFQSPNTSFSVEMSDGEIKDRDVSILFDIIRSKPEKTFDFSYVFNNPSSSPFFPSASYGKDGYSIGLQPTDLSWQCDSLNEWLEKMRLTWQEIVSLFGSDKAFLGIDSSVAPLFEGKGSLINFVKRLGPTFSRSATSDIYLRISDFIKNNNPQPVGLCGLMFPCLEDFELADEYEKSNFSIERNVFLSLHCGLGIDTFPIGIDEEPKRVQEVLTLLQKLSNKYQKPLSARFVSDGKAKIGEKTDFRNQYLRDVLVREL